MGLLKLVTYSAKFGGATGNFNATHIAYPEIDWTRMANSFVKQILGLERSQVRTQIEHYLNLATSCDAVKRINTILADIFVKFFYECTGFGFVFFMKKQSFIIGIF